MAEQPRTHTDEIGSQGEDQEVLRRTADDLFEQMQSEAEAPGGDEPAKPREDDSLPPMTEQISQQLGGIRGLIESGIPVGVFVLANVFLSDGLRWAFDISLAEGTALRWAIGASVGVAVLIAIMRALRKEPIRHALNGLLGIGIGAYLAWKSGDQGDFYLPGIIQGSAYGLALMGSVAIRHPLVGWFWSVIAGGGKSQWREDKHLVKVFGWLTMLWGAVFLLKNLFRAWLYANDLDTIQGLVTLVGGYPVTALLFVITVWVVRRSRPSMTLRGPKSASLPKITTRIGSSASSVHTNTSSSPDSRVSSGVGGMTRVPRRMATSEQSGGSGTAWTACPT